MAKAVCAEFNKNVSEFKLKPSAVIADLGLERGSRRQNKIKHNKRVSQAFRQLSKFRKVSKFSRIRLARRKLTLMSPVPRIAYGAMATGMAPSQIVK
eukprot:8115971-Pyramimonas_sp.AAC.1